MKKLGNCKYKTQLFVYFFMVIGIIVTGLGIVGYTVLAKSYKEQEKEMLTNQAKQIVINVDHCLDYYQSYMDLLLMDKNFMVQLKYSTFERVSEYLETTTEEFMWLNVGRISEINLYRQGIYDEKHGFFRSKQQDNVDEQLTESEYAYTESYLNSRNEKVFSVFKKINLVKPERWYYIEFRIYETELYRFFNGDNSGNDIRICNGTSVMSMSDRREFLKQLQYGKSNPSEKMEFKESGNKIPISAECENGWQVVINTNLDYLNRGLKNVLQRMAPVLLFTILVLLFCVTKISNQMNRKLEFIQSKIMAIGHNKYEVNENILKENLNEFQVLESEINRTNVYINQLLTEIENRNQSMRQSEMVALRAQINSHFLFNALATLKWLTRSTEGVRILPEAIEKLAVFLRYSISIQENVVPLHRELEQLEAYIYLQKLKCGDELNVILDVEEELQDCITVKLILQPLLENAISHGRKEDGSVINIAIYSYYDDEYYYLVVEDDGNGMTQERVEMVKAGTIGGTTGGYGLKNIMERIDICTGGKGDVIIESEIGKFTKIVVKQKR